MPPYGGMGPGPIPGPIPGCIIGGIIGGGIIGGIPGAGSGPRISLYEAAAAADEAASEVATTHSKELVPALVDDCSLNFSIMLLIVILSIWEASMRGAKTGGGCI